MVLGLAVLAFLAGGGFGLVGGILFARMDQSRVFDLITTTTDKLTTSALFPGLKGIVPQVESPTEQMYDDEGVDPARVPGFLLEDDDAGPWDHSTLEEVPS